MNYDTDYFNEVLEKAGVEDRCYPFDLIQDTMFPLFNNLVDRVLELEAEVKKLKGEVNDKPDKECKHEFVWANKYSDLGYQNPNPPFDYEYIDVNIYVCAHCNEVRLDAD